MIKLVLLMKRRPGMSFDDFVEYYEIKHRLIGLKCNKGARRYMRRYLRKLENPVFGVLPEPEYDVMAEIWYDNKAEMDKGLAQWTADEEAAEDSAKLIDLGAKLQIFVVYDERIDDNP